MRNYILLALTILSVVMFLTQHFPIAICLLGIIASIRIVFEDDE